MLIETERATADGFEKENSPYQSENLSDIACGGGELSSLETGCDGDEGTARVDAVLSAHPLDHYSRLLLPYGADLGMARSQFSRLAKLVHPDKSVARPSFV